MSAWLCICPALFGRVLYPNLADAYSVIPTIAQNLLPEWGLAIVAVGLFCLHDGLRGFHDPLHQRHALGRYL